MVFATALKTGALIAATICAAMCATGSRTKTLRAAAAE